jgi:thioredoxin reductase (NADPH)
MLESTVPRHRPAALDRAAHTQATLATTEQIPDTLVRELADSRPERWADVIVIGAGPTGLACAIEAQKIGAKVTVLDKGCLVNSIFHYPANMTFFTTPELLEIGDIPFSTANMKPTRHEALEYYRKVAEHYQLHVCQYYWVKTVVGEDNNFRLTATDRRGGIHDFRARKVIVSTGYYDLPNVMHIPGEDLPKVFHYYHEPHP